MLDVLVKKQFPSESLFEFLTFAVDIVVDLEISEQGNVEVDFFHLFLKHYGQFVPGLQNSYDEVQNEETDHDLDEDSVNKSGRVEQPHVDSHVVCEPVH